MSPFRLVTLDGVSLTGRSGPIALTDPRQLALLVRLAGAPGRTATTDQLLLSIWPHLTQKQGEAELQAAVEAVGAAAGTALIGQEQDRWNLDRAVTCDNDLAPPTRAATFGQGLELPDTPEWGDWLATARQEIARRPAPRPPAAWRRLWIGAVAAIGAVALLVSRTNRPRAIAGFTPGDRVILADVANTTADSGLGRSLQVAAAVALNQSTRLELFSRPRMLASLQSVGRTVAPGQISREVAIELAVREAVPWVIVIGVDPDGPRRRVTTELVRVESHSTVATESRTAAGLLDLVEVVGKTLSGLLLRMGEPRQVVRGQPILSFATTSDLEALRAYADGAIAWRRGDFDFARDYWHRALALDTGFAMAMGSLGSYYYYHHDTELGERYYQQALARRGRLTEWERLQIESRYQGYRRNFDSALALGRLIVARYPRAETFYDYGTSLLQAGRCAEALEPLDRSRQLDSRNRNTLINLATCQKSLGRYRDARQSYLAAERVDSLALYVANINLEYAGALLLAGYPADAESALVRMTRRPAMGDQALGFRGLGYLAHWRGQVRQAFGHFRRASAMSRQQGAQNGLFRNLALEAAMQQVLGDQSASRQAVDELETSLSQPNFIAGLLVLAAEPFSDAADLAALRSLLAQIGTKADPRGREDSSLVHFVAGSLALATGAPQVALDHLRLATAFWNKPARERRRAQAFEQLGQRDSARAILADIVAHPSFGAESQLAFTRALIEIGPLEERMGRPVDAVASYRRFLAHWKNADPDLPDVVRARARVAALAGADR